MFDCTKSMEYALNTNYLAENALALNITSLFMKIPPLKKNHEVGKTKWFKPCKPWLLYFPITSRYYNTKRKKKYISTCRYQKYNINTMHRRLVLYLFFQ